MIIIIQPNENGKIELTKERLQEYLEQAKEEGAKEERNRFIANPYIPLVTFKSTEYQPTTDWEKIIVTCSSTEK